MTTTTVQSPPAIYQSPPHLVWPVSRREFYRAIWVALLPALAWGLILFGFRPLYMLLSAVSAATLTHVLLKRGLKWQRAQFLVYPHSLVSALILVALSLPTWPAWVVAGAALLLPLLLALLGGPGRERIHVAVVAVVVIQFAVLPYLSQLSYAGRPDAILAHDRLFMGDIRDQRTGPPSASPTHAWPNSRELGGNDAVPFTPPAVVAVQTLNQISALLPTEHSGQPDPLSPAQESVIRGILDRAFAFNLPSMDSFIFGVAPNRIGAASLIAIAIAGLFLSYRNILRPHSLLIFLLAYIAASAAFAFTPATVHRAGPLAVWDLFSRFPGEIISLIEFLLLNSDAPFAAVFILALPGTGPLTARALRIFLVIAALAAATLHRMVPALPAASLILTAMMPLSPLFDRLFARPSWLSSR